VQETTPLHNQTKVSVVKFTPGTLAKNHQDLQKIETLAARALAEVHCTDQNLHLRKIITWLVTAVRAECHTATASSMTCAHAAATLLHFVTNPALTRQPQPALPISAAACTQQ
jgi:hypothetical protein